MSATSKETIGTLTGQRTNASPYAGCSDSRLKETHGYWMSIIRAAKNPAQRERADRNCAAVATEMRKRAALAKAAS